MTFARSALCSRFALIIGLFGLGQALPAQVAEWRVFKSAVYEQTANNTMPTAPHIWAAGAYVVTNAANDAGLITISGGNIAGSRALQHLGGGEWQLELEYGSQAAMNAEFPSNATYTLTISGGSLGLLIQQVTVGPEQYPATPFLTGSTYDDLQQLAPTVANNLTWSHPGPLTQTSGLTGFEITDRVGNVEFDFVTPGAVTSTTLPANTLAADACHYGWLEFTSDLAQPAGGFGVAGWSHHTTALDFEIRTWTFPTPPCAWTQNYGEGCANLGIFGSNPILGSSWDVTTVGLEPNALAITSFAFGPQNPPLPLSAFGLNAPGCSSYISLSAIAANVSGIEVGGQIVVSIAVPASPSFGGIVFFAQTAALTPFTPAGIGTSDLLEAKFGS